jgi:hypothetical protein
LASSVWLPLIAHARPALRKHWKYVDGGYGYRWFIHCGALQASSDYQDNLCDNWVDRPLALAVARTSQRAGLLMARSQHRS